jgi:hypothetical protein
MGWSKDVSGQWAAYNTPSLTCETSGITTSQHPMHLRTHNRESPSPQMAVLSPQSESSNDMPFWGLEESRRCYKDVVCKKCSNGNKITEVNNNKLRHLHEEKTSSPQMAAMLSQSESSNSTPFLVPEESKQHHRDVIHESFSYVNMVTEVNDVKLCHPPEERMSSHQMATTSSQSEPVDGRRVLVTEESR